MAEEGELDLDAPASAILPELPPLAGMPTLRQFMSQGSALTGSRARIQSAPVGRLSPPRGIVRCRRVSRH
jgi:CubicO group peptidase (beta-lactamase class C family)